MTRGSSTRHSYDELLSLGRPRSISNEDEAAAVQAQIDVLIDRGEQTEAESEYLSLLGDLIWVWEQGKYERPRLSPIEMVRSLLEDGGYRQKDLVPTVFPTTSIASAVLNGKRRLTYDYVQKLAEFFHVSPSLFFESPTQEASPRSA